ncbi:MAG TPA: glutaredoxin family protein [Candidatus Acidoferrales bacterium]|nr:glutaredoxin family protein [Candidatus Acidoferrales bacterium]
MKLQLTLYTRPRCGLCDLLHEDLLALCRDRAVAIVPINVDSDPDLKARYGVRIPVVVGDGTVLCEGRLDASAVRAFLDRHVPMAGTA